MNGDFDAKLPRGLQQIQCADSVRVEIVEWNGSGPVMARVRGGMNNDSGANFFYQVKNPCPVANVQFMVNKAGRGCLQTLLIPARVALRPKKHRALVIIRAVDLITKLTRKIHANFRANQAG